MILTQRKLTLKLKLNFEIELKQTLNKLQIATYDEFEKAFLLVPNKQAPMISKILRANHAHINV